MKTAFTEDWKKEEEIKKAYHAAKEKGDEAGMETARNDIRELNERIAGKGEAYCRIYRSYRDAMERGNDSIDFSESIWDNEVEGLIEDLRRFGIKTFTFSSTWSSSVKTAWLFRKNGCTLEGMVEINGSDCEKIPAYLFRAS